MATAKVVIKGENQLKKPIKEAQSDLSSFGQAAEKLGQSLKNALAVGTVVASIGKLASTAKACFNEFAEAEQKYKKLAMAAKDTKAFESMTDTISKLSRQTLASKGDIESMVTELAQLGKSSDEIDSISSAAVALSEVTGQNLNSSMKTLLNTYNGNTTQLKRLGIEVDDFTKKELQSGAAIELVNEKFGKYVEELAENSTSQSFKNISDTMGDIRQAIGAMVDFNIKDFAKNFDEGLSGAMGKVTQIIATTGAVIKNFPSVFKALMDTLFNMFKKTFEWNSIKILFTTALTNVGIIAKDVIKAVFLTIPTMLSDLLKGIGNWLAYLGASIYDTIHNAVGNSIADAIDWVADKTPGWLKNLLNMDGGFRDSLRSTSDKASGYKQASDTAFSALGSDITYAVESAVASAQLLKDNTKNALSSVYGDIAIDFANTVQDIIGDDIEKLSGIISTNGGNTVTVGSDLSSTVDDEKGKTKLEELMEEFSGLTSLVSNLKSLMNPLNVILGAFFEELNVIVSRALAPLFDALKNIGTTLADLLIPVLDLILPAINAIAATINWACDWIRYAVGKLTFWTEGDNTAKPGSWNEYYDQLGTTTGGISTDTAVASSSYTGGNNITINVYQSGAVVGDSGMRQFAQMIKNEFDELNYYGVA